MSSNINANVFTANSVSVIAGDFAITATNADPDQTNAYAITKDYNVVSVSAGHGDAVRLPVPTVGRLITIVNNGAKDVGVYPSADCAIDNFGTDAVYYLASGSCQSLVAVSTAKWTRLNRWLRRVAVGGSPPQYDTSVSWSPTKNDQWHALDISSHVPPSSRGRPLGVRMFTDRTNPEINLGRDGANDTADVITCKSWSVGVETSNKGTITTGADGVVHYRIRANEGRQQIYLSDLWVEG